MVGRSLCNKSIFDRLEHLLAQVNILYKEKYSITPLATPQPHGAHNSKVALAGSVAPERRYPCYQI